jgi:mitogen-activated protein kinase 15
LKPSNLLINSDCRVKLGDFGLARSLIQTSSEEEPDLILTDYVATRWYRAPEMILGSRNYTKSIDMWSCGCILVELLSGKPLFPGSSLVNQLYRILEVVGKIGNDDFESIDSAFGKHLYCNIRPTKTKKLAEFIPNASKEATDLVLKLLRFNPKKRITVEEALKHPYFSKFHNPHDEPESLRIISTPINDNIKLDIFQYRKSIYNEIFKRRNEYRRKMKAKKELHKLIVNLRTK